MAACPRLPELDADAGSVAGLALVPPGSSQRNPPMWLHGVGVASGWGRGGAPRRGPEGEEPRGAAAGLSRPGACGWVQT